tara:strand:+ start:2444 stop:2677 length:234 start_codon:yes stop_codon:yes gene_type:complete
MSATVTWKPHSPDDSGEWAGKGALLKALKECFGELPVILDESDIRVLHGIKAGGISDAENLIDAIEKIGSIKVDVEY